MGGIGSGRRFQNRRGPNLTKHKTKVLYQRHDHIFIGIEFFTYMRLNEFVWTLLREKDRILSEV
jgi:hypothetical protein